MTYIKSSFSYLYDRLELPREFEIIIKIQKFIKLTNLDRSELNETICFMPPGYIILNQHTIDNVSKRAKYLPGIWDFAFYSYFSKKKEYKILDESLGY